MNRSTGILKQAFLIVSLTMCLILLGSSCATGNDPRLNGTWVSNPEASVAASYERNPRLTNATPAKLKEFSSLFGHLSMSYSNGVGISHLYGVDEIYHYRVLEKGRNYVVIRTTAPGDDGHEIRMRFDNGGKSYWIRTPYGPTERFDKVKDE